MRTIVGREAKFVGRRTTDHMIYPNLMSSPGTKEQGLQYEADLKKRLNNVRLVHGVKVNAPGRLLYVTLNMCNNTQRVATLRKVLAALEAMKLHDPTQGLDSFVDGLE